MAGMDADMGYLKQEKIFDHLGSVIDRVVAEKPKDAYGLVEVLSRLVKEQAAAGEAAPGDAVEIEALTEHVQKLKQLDKAPEEEGTEVPVCAIPDFVEDAETLSWAGVGLGDVESYKVMCSLRNLAAKEKDAGITKLRFWGKVLGTEADYYVAEAVREGGGEEEDADPDAEKSGEGANQFTYYVTNDLAGEWRRLPDIKPREIIAARSIKRLLTGNAGSKVVTHPFFDGKEEVYLRAQIARITADTTLCVKGFLKKDPDDPEAPIEVNEEFVCPPASELKTKEAFTHLLPHILLNGRTTHKEIEEGDTPEEQAAAAKLKEEQAADPVRELNRELTGDGLEWTVKQAGDPTLYKPNSDPAAPLKSDLVTCVRSLSWPGAVFVVRGGVTTNLYIGYGLAAAEPAFFPPAPPDVQDEPEDCGEVEEPHAAPAEPVAEEGAE
eukprot:TRINITY_DN63027_c0_g1_i1.p1 TRINITY_DN63027_c0_g1~~TRINITY_DN63027_c0_g1_i1.p1  ORF type:complete len:438 (+),score=136.87 TRINITY_DN63027_c0_g1_i1:91-1404(+)